MEKTVYDIWLSLAVVPGEDTFFKLRESFCDSEKIYSLEEKELALVLGKKTSECKRLLDKDLTRAKKIYEFCKKHGVGILTYGDERFPTSLREIPTPPVLLYYRGVLPDFDASFCVSVVGTRRLSKYGRRNAFSISYDLASAGAVIVSGMATGIDGVAHAGALSAGGKTVAVLGSGIDVCYPIEHKTLAREIVKTGCVFTEYPPGTRPERFNFPKRNRIISGLCATTLVIEGPERSGALISARHAAEQGRAVYALPGNVESKNSQLTNLLLKNGAKVCTSADDIVRDFEKKYAGIINPFALSQSKHPKMEDVLSAYRVSATSAEDDIFDTRPHRAARSSKKKISEAPQEPSVKTDSDVSDKKVKTEERTPVGFDERTLKIYKKIPRGGSCLIESLVDDEFSLRDVMRSLLKLEMGRFVKLLPGERVARNL
ncbi:MAG: DNA-processing protein DprA [Clostridia bacterium]|nr:DNA-processing protein DprA [Clostridia bacterium]